MGAYQAHHDLYDWELHLLLDAIDTRGPAADQPPGAPAPGGDPFAAPPSSLSEL